MSESSSTAKAPKRESQPPEESSSGYADDPTLLLRGNQAPAPKSDSTNANRKSQVNKETNKKPSVHAMRAAMAHQVPLPAEDDEEYGPLDEYVDQLLGTSTSDGRPRLDQLDHEEVLRGEVPQMIFSDGTKGPVPDVVKRRAGNARAPDTPYLSSLIERWSDVDAVALERSRQGHEHRAAQEQKHEAHAELPKKAAVHSSYRGDTRGPATSGTRSDILDSRSMATNDYRAISEA